MTFKIGEFIFSLSSKWLSFQFFDLLVGAWQPTIFFCGCDILRNCLILINKMQISRVTFHYFSSVMKVYIFFVETRILKTGVYTSDTPQVLENSLCVSQNQIFIRIFGIWKNGISRVTGNNIFFCCFSDPAGPSC